MHSAARLPWGPTPGVEKKGKKKSTFFFWPRTRACRRSLPKTRHAARSHSRRPHCVFTSSGLCPVLAVLPLEKQQHRALESRTESSVRLANAAHCAAFEQPRSSPPHRAGRMKKCGMQTRALRVSAGSSRSEAAELSRPNEEPSGEPRTLPAMGDESTTEKPQNPSARSLLRVFSIHSWLERCVFVH